MTDSVPGGTENWHRKTFAIPPASHHNPEGSQEDIIQTYAPPRLVEKAGLLDA